MRRYLLDTNVLSEPVKPEPNRALLRRIQQHKGRICTASPIWHELLFGCRRLRESKRRQLLSEYLRTLQSSLAVLPYDRRAADWHAEERARLSRLGRTPPFVDGQIAAIAAVNELIVVTANTVDFEGFAELRTENWLEFLE